MRGLMLASVAHPPRGQAGVGFHARAWAGNFQALKITLNSLFKFDRPTAIETCQFKQVPPVRQSVLPAVASRRDIRYCRATKNCYSRVPNHSTGLLGDEPDPRDLMRSFPAAPMRMWPISTRVNKPENSTSIVEPVEFAA
jgi:hypothetical protein